MFDVSPDTMEADRLEILTTLVEDNENKRYSIPISYPVEAIKYYLKSRGLSRRDLELYLGTRSRVSEILNRSPLSLEMIRRLHNVIGIQADVLIQPYETVQRAS
jgi:HTH-type transcriptional regulator/antitoxin HigA